MPNPNLEQLIATDALPAPDAGNADALVTARYGAWRHLRMRSYRRQHHSQVIDPYGHVA
jgi:hypothetical protein